MPLEITPGYRGISSICTEILALQPFPYARAGTYEYAIRFGILRESRSAYLGSFRFVLPPILMPRYHASRNSGRLS